MSASHLGKSFTHGLSQKLCKPCSPCSNEGNEDLGNWEAHRGRELHTLDGVTWSISLPSKSQTQIEYKYVRISELSGNYYVRWELGENNRRYDMKHSRVVNEVERGFQDSQPLQSDSNRDGSTDSENEELHSASKVSDLVVFVNLSR